MQLRVLRPDGVVQLPDGTTMQRATPMLALRQAVAAPAPRPALLVPTPVPTAVRAPVRVVRADPEVTETAPATSVGLVPAAGTLVTSTPANLLAGPEATISNFTIISLDSGTW